MKILILLTLGILGWMVAATTASELPLRLIMMACGFLNAVAALMRAIWLLKRSGI